MYQPSNDNGDDMPTITTDERRLARNEARDIIEEVGAAGVPEKIDQAADGLLKSLRSYDQGPDFGRLVYKELRLRSREARQGIG